MNFSTLFFLWTKDVTDEPVLVGYGIAHSHGFAAVEILQNYSKQYFVTGSRDSLVGMATGLRVGRSRSRGSIPVKGKKCLSSP
jgi:hypothetical protein